MTDPQSRTTSGFHIFLEPEGAAKEEFSKIITALAKEYGGPVFMPHVTILAQIPAEGSESSLESVFEMTQSFASSLSPCTITIDGFATADTYFKALYGNVKEKEELRKIHAHANSMFSMIDESPYEPHLSLLYGNYLHEQKQNTIATLELPAQHSFVAHALSLYKTEGEVSDWKLINMFPFGE